MKKEFVIQFVFLVAFFLLISLYKTFIYQSANWFDFPYIEFWVGGIIGTILVYSDHFIYAYLLKPDEYSSQMATKLISQRKADKALETLLSTHQTSDKLIFHNALIQSLFVVFAFWVITSSGSLLGRGIVLSFLLHLLVDMARDLSERKSLKRWFADFPLEMDETKGKWYLVVQILILVTLGFFL